MASIFDRRFRARRRRPTFERLEWRTLLAAEVGNWFAAAPTADGAEYGPQLPTSNWIVRLAPTAVAEFGGPLSTTELLGSSWLTALTGPVRLTPQRGLGSPGLLLVRAQGVADDVTGVLLSHPYIVSAHPDQSIAVQQLPNDPDFNRLVGLQNTGSVLQNSGTPGSDIDAPLAWDITTGSSSIVVGMVDSGIDYTHPDLAANIWVNPGEANGLENVDDDNNGLIDDIHGYDFANDDGDPFDDNGHGTHVAGTVAAVGNNGIGVAGVAWSAKLMGLKFLNRNNEGTLSNAIRAINYATMMRSEHGVNVRVLNNSWGVSGGSADAELRAAIEDSGAAGILFIAAAGNGDVLGRGLNIDESPFYPASFDLGNIVSVAASDQNDRLARFSNFGVRSVDLAAPGVGILSTEPGGQYGYRNGTSMATPHVTGAAVLAFAQHPDAAALEVREALVQGAEALPQLKSRVATGGRLNAARTAVAQTFAPRATLISAPDIVIASSNPQRINITYSSSKPLDVGSIDHNDILVRRLGFDGTVLATTLSQRTVNAAETVVQAEYALAPPGGTWDALDAGTYEIVVRASQVRDRDGLASAEAVVGTFRVQIADLSVLFVNTFADTRDANPADGLARDTEGRTSLRAAIQHANALPGAHKIVLPAGEYRISLIGTAENASATGDFDVAGNIEILGDDALTTIISGQQHDRVFDVSSTGRLKLSNLTVTRGNAASGGGIFNAGMLTLERAVVRENVAESAGGGLQNTATGRIDIVQSLVADNATTDALGLGGGGLFNSGIVTVDQSTFTKNSSAAGSLSSDGGGAIHNASSGALDITNSTLSGNVAASGGGGAIYNIGDADIENATIVDNYAPQGRAGGIFNQGGPTAPIVYQSKFGANGFPLGTLSTASGLAVDSQGNIYVADEDNHRVQVFAPDGFVIRSIGSFGSAPGQFHTPTQVALDTTGNIYVLDVFNSRCQIFDPQGNYLRSLQQNMVNLFVDSTGRIIAQNYETLYVYNNAGTLVFTMPQVVRPLIYSDYAVDAAGRFFITKHYSDSDKRLDQYDAQGNFVKSIPIRYAGDLAIASNGDIYMTTDVGGQIDVFTNALVFKRTITVAPGYDIAFDAQDNLYLDRGTSVARYAAPSYTAVTTFGRSTVTAESKRNVAVDGQNRVYVADTENARVQVYTNAGIKLREFGREASAVGRLTEPVAVEIDDASGQVYVVDCAAHRVVVYSAAGVAQFAFGGLGTTAGKMSSPGSIAIGNGRIYVGDGATNRVQAFSPAGAFLFQFALTEADPSRTPGALAIDSLGRVYVAGKGRVEVFTSDGVFLRSFGSAGAGQGQFSSPPKALAVDAAFNVHVADPSQDRVQVFGATGNFLFEYGGTGSGNGQFRGPRGIAIDSTGLVYVTDTHNDRVQQFRPTAAAARRVELHNTAIALNQAALDWDVAGVFVSQGYNFIGRIGFGAGGFSAAAGDLLGTNESPREPDLEPLSANTGFVPWHLPRAGSPLLDAGDNQNAVGVDQLGRVRPQDADGDSLPEVDIGAVERMETIVSGRAFHDANANGTIDEQETGVAGWTVYIDANSNSQFDGGEPFTLTTPDDPATPQVNESGAYSLSLLPGNYRLGMIPGPAFAATTPLALSTTQSRTLYQIATGTSIGTPAIDGERIAYFDNQAGAGVSIADRNSKTFIRTFKSQSFDPSFDDGIVAFQQFSGAFREIVQIRPDGSVAVVADGNTTIPDVDREFDEANFFDVDTSAGLMAFRARSDSDPNVAGFYAGVPGNLLRLASLATPVPAQPGKVFSFFAGSDLDGSRYSFSGQSVNGGDIYGVYLGSPSIGLTRIADSSILIGNRRLSRIQTYTAIVADSVAFSGYFRIGAGTEQPGLFIGSSPSAIRVVADSATPIPQGTGTFGVIEDLSADDNFIAFVGESADRAQFGVYAEIQGQLVCIVNERSRFDGRVPRLYELSHDAIDGNRLAFRVQFTDNTASVYIVEVPRASFHTFTIGVGGERTNLNFGAVALPGSASGKVFEDLDADGIFDANEAAREGMLVFVDANRNGIVDAGEKTATTDAAGAYAFENLDALALHTIAIQVPAGLSQTFPTAASDRVWTITPGAGEAVGNLHFGVRPTGAGGAAAVSGRLQGTVFNDLNQNGALDAPQEQTLAGAAVFLDQNANGVRDLQEPQVITGASGGYEFSNLPAGNYAVRVVLPADQRQTTPSGNLLTASTITVGQAPQAVVAANFDGLPGVDLAVVNGGNNDVQLLTNSGTGTFSAGPRLPTGTVPSTLAVGNFDGQGGPDLAVGNLYSRSITLFTNTGSAANPLALNRTIATGTGATTSANGPRALVAADFNNDGYDDLAIANEFSNDITFLRNRATGDGSFHPPLVLASQQGPSAIAAADLNNDGRRDLAVANYESNNVVVYWGNGAGGFTAGPILNVDLGPFGITAGDFDSDGHVDLATANALTGNVALLWNNGNQTFAPKQGLPAGAGATSVAAVDIDGDLDLDLAVTNSTDKNLSLLRNRGGRRFATAESFGVASFPVSLAFSVVAADIDNDFMPDLAVVNPNRSGGIGSANGSVSILRNTTTAGAHRVSITGTDTVTDLNFGLRAANLGRAPTLAPGQSFALDENAPGGTFVGQVQATELDANDPLSFAIMAGNTNNAFTIDAQGRLHVQNSAALNFEGQASFSLVVRATDSTGLFGQASVTVQLVDLNERPSDILLASFQVSENSPGASVGAVTVIDPDVGATHTLTVNDGRFQISGGVLRLKAGVSLDRESEPTVGLTISAMDNGLGNLSFSKSFTLSVLNVNERPTQIVVSNLAVRRNAPGDIVGEVSVLDPEGGPHSFSVSDARFEVAGGLLRLKAGVSLDASAGSAISLFLTATDNTNLSLTESLSIAVVTAAATPWRNAARPLDVNGDAAVTALDAVLILNELNAGRSGPLAPPPVGQSAPLFLDTSGDNELSPLDALLVINGLNSGQGQAEHDPAAIDEVFRQWNG